MFKINHFHTWNKQVLYSKKDPAKMFSSDISVYYLANAGIYLTDKKTGILVDGLFDHYDGFDFLPESIETAVMNKQTPFGQLTSLLFTHTHIDHYSSGKVSAFLKRYPETGCILPEQKTSASRTFSLCPFPSAADSSASLVVQVHARHLLDKGKIVPHTALFLKYAGQSFFFSGDSDPVFLNRNIPQETLSAFCGQVSMAFVNPFFFSLTPGRKFLETLNPGRIFVYHMPLQVPDSLRYHEILNRGLSKYTGKMPVQVLDQFMYRLQQ